jgi:uncharacterized protein (DUF2235 family)
MSKNIVLCSDGTGNQDVKDRGTNVFKLYEAVDVQGHKQKKVPTTQQLAFYDDGVGTSQIPLAKAIGGATGWGFSRNVRQLYRELVNVYEAGDNIYLFGFSRGAYTVRALAGLIQHCGVLDIRLTDRGYIDDRIKHCWKEFREVAFRRSFRGEHRGLVPEEDEARRIAETEERLKRYGAVKHENSPRLTIKFIGVWDTVGAIGVPFDWLRYLINLIYPIWFRDNTLGPYVEKACHALSIDDDRRTFFPELWNERYRRGDDKKGEFTDRRIKQVWFAGVHSNVGGGYPKQGMSLVTLDWMMHEAREAGLRFIDNDRKSVIEHQDVQDKLYDPRSGLGLFYRWAPRNIDDLCKKHKIGVPKIHISVFERIACGTDSYAPGNIPFKFEVDATSGIENWPAETLREPIRERVTEEIDRTVNATKGTTATSLLEMMRSTVQSGILSYWAFVVVTAVFVVHLLKLPAIRESFPDLISALTSLNLVAFSVGVIKSPIWRIAPLYIVLGILIALWANLTDRILERRFREFWRDLREKLRNTLSIKQHRSPQEPVSKTLLTPL